MIVTNMPARQKKVWIDLDNSPHVPFFIPIIEELRARGYAVFISARDCFQVCELADILNLKYKRIGRHYGKSKLLKVAGLGLRAMQLVPSILGEKPDLAISHGSRAQLVSASMLRVPTIVIFDYEFVKGLGFVHPTWVMVPEVIPDSALGETKNLLKYPGIKEDVYVAGFKADPKFRAQLGLDKSELLVTLRPPANEAHYHSVKSDELFNAVVDYLGGVTGLQMVVLPRNHKQEINLRNSWPRLFEAGKIVIPEHAVDGLNLIWHSDFVVSGGGTMNREAAALNVPVYSVFRGKTGAVDRYLAKAGRMVLLETIADVKSKIALKQRDRNSASNSDGGIVLKYIVDQVVKVLESAPRMAGTNYDDAQPFSSRSEIV
jgi:predicted glycosyltransferase